MSAAPPSVPSDCAVCNTFGLSCEEIEALLGKTAFVKSHLQSEMEAMRKRSSQREAELREQLDELWTSKDLVTSACAELRTQLNAAHAALAEAQRTNPAEDEDAAPTVSPDAASVAKRPRKEIKASLKAFRAAMTHPVKVMTPAGEYVDIHVEHEFLHINDESKLEWMATFQGENRSTNVASLHHTLCKLGVRDPSAGTLTALGTRRSPDELKEGIVVASVGTSSTQVYSSSGVVGAFYIGTGAFTTFSETRRMMHTAIEAMLRPLEEQVDAGIIPTTSAIVFISAIGYLVGQDVRLDGASRSLKFDRSGERAAAKADAEAQEDYVSSVRWGAELADVDLRTKRRLERALSLVTLNGSTAALQSWLERNSGAIEAIAQLDDQRSRALHRQLLLQRARLNRVMRADLIKVEAAAGALLGILDAAAGSAMPWQVVVKKRGNMRIVNSWTISDHAGDAVSEEGEDLHGRFMVDLGGGGPALTYAGSGYIGVADIGKSRMLRGNQDLFVREVVDAGFSLTPSQVKETEVASYLFAGTAPMYAVLRQYIEATVQRHFTRVYEIRRQELLKAHQSTAPRVDGGNFVITILQTGNIRQLYWEGTIGYSTDLLREGAIVPVDRRT